MARRSEHSQKEIKQMVLQAAEDIVKQQGFSALKVRKIAADIGYTVGSIYMVFDNMNDLNMHIKARTWQKLACHLEQGIDTEEPVSLTTVERLAIAYLDFTVLNKGLWCMLFEHQLPADKAVPDWYLQENEQVLTVMYQIIRQLCVSCSDAQVKQAAQTLTKSIQGVCMQLVMQQQTKENIIKARMDIVQLVDCFIRGWVNSPKISHNK